jgi:phosphatidylserine/phosphatidylglycerophosphate/cardiolipin synthase-like enzyme
VSAAGCRARAGALALAALLLAACGSLPKPERVQLAEAAVAARSAAVDCPRADACAAPSSFREAGVAHVAASTDGAPKHELVLLERGSDALAVRLALIRSAQRRIELKSFIFQLDDSGKLVLDALLDAAERGVEVRVLLDQLYGLDDANLQAALAGHHRRFALRLYNPTFDEAETQPLEFAAGIVCCFRRFNQRLHSKLLLVDDAVAITGGRNVQDRYFDWDPVYNYRDRDLVVGGPVVADMRAAFEAFWTAERSVPAERLADVARRWQKHGGPPQGVLAWREALDEGRLATMAQAAGDDAALREALRDVTFDVGAVRFATDLPQKHEQGAASRRDASEAMRELIANAREDVLLQTPYLVMSRPARRLFQQLHERDTPPTVRVSTNSLAATDAFPVYGMSHKYKRTYLRELGFTIHEYKPYPTDTPIDPAATGALGEQAAIDFPLFGSATRGGNDGPVPLRRAGVRVGLHAKSIVIDRRIGVVGTHNFDPRSDHWNTESMVVVEDAAFADVLARNIERDMAPENAWLIAPRRRPPLLRGLGYSLGKLSEALPVFDLWIWPFPYARSYALKPGCAPVPWGDPRFFDCWEDVGDFPEVEVGSKRIYTRIMTGFGAGLTPIL